MLGRRSAPRTVLESAPEGASIIASIDAPALLGSPIWRALTEEDGGQGLARIEGACGFDPLERLRTVAVFIVGTEARPLERTGFLARGDLPREELVRCVERVVGEDGGSIRRVEIEGMAAIASENGPSRAAFVGEDGVLGGDETVVRAMLRVQQGEADGAGTDPALGAMWRRVEHRAEVIAVARVPSNWREWLGRIGGQIDLEALVGVERIGLGARIRTGLGLTLALETGSADAARELRDAARARIEAALEQPMLGTSALGAALRHAEIEAEGATAIATIDLDQERLEALIQLIRHQLAMRRSALERARARAFEEEPAPDETIRAEQ